MLKQLRAFLLPADLSYSRWVRTCKLVTLGGGLLAGLFSLALSSLLQGWHWHVLLISLLLAIFSSLAVAFAFLLSRELSLQLGRRIVASMEEAAAHGGTPDLPNAGWDVFDRGRKLSIQMLLQRDEQIAALACELAFYRPLAEEMPGLELVLAADGRLRWASPAIESLTGYTVAACLAEPDATEPWAYPKDRQMLHESIAAAMRGEALENLEFRVQRKDESVFWCAGRCYPLRDAGGNVTGVRLSAQDIQLRKDAEHKLLETVAALRRAQALKEHYLGRSNDERMRLAALLEIVNLGILFVDRDRRAVYLNQTFADQWKLGERSTVVGMRDEALLDATAPLRIDNPAYLKHIEQAISRRSAETQYDIQCTDGRVVRERSSVVPGSDGARPLGRVWLYEDITDTLRTQERLTEQAERDPLTNLYNRRRFHEDLDRQLAEAMRRSEMLGLIIFDLDGFKDINDSFGHHAGDTVLRSLAEEVGSVIRRNELLFRLGGDEFAVIVTHPTLDSITHLARRVVEKVSSMRFAFEEGGAGVTVSVGISLCPVNGRDTEALLHAADRAMYQAKNAGKNRWALASRT